MIDRSRSISYVGKLIAHRANYLFGSQRGETLDSSPERTRFETPRRPLVGVPPPSLPPLPGVAASFRYVIIDHRTAARESRQSRARAIHRARFTSSRTGGGGGASERAVRGTRRARISAMQFRQNIAKRVTRGMQAHIYIYICTYLYG